MTGVLILLLALVYSGVVILPTHPGPILFDFSAPTATLFAVCVVAMGVTRAVVPFIVDGVFSAAGAASRISVPTPVAKFMIKAWVATCVGGFIFTVVSILLGR